MIAGGKGRGAVGRASTCSAPARAWLSVGGTVLGFSGTHLGSGRKLGIYAILIGGFVLGPMILFVLSFFLQEWVSALRRG